MLKKNAPRKRGVLPHTLQVLVEQKIICDSLVSVMKTPNKIAIAVSFVHCTDKRGARIKVEIPRMHTKKFLPYSHKFNCAADEIEKLLGDNDIWPVCQAEFKDSVFFMVNFDEWEKLRTIFG